MAASGATAAQRMAGIQHTTQVTTGGSDCGGFQRARLLRRPATAGHRITAAAGGGQQHNTRGPPPPSGASELPPHSAAAAAGIHGSASQSSQPAVAAAAAAARSAKLAKLEAVATARAKGDTKPKNGPRLNRFANRKQWAYVDQRTKFGGDLGPVMVGGMGSRGGGGETVSIRQVGFWPHMRFDQRQYRQELSAIGNNPKTTTA